jgi:hypothetical protein
MLRHNLLVIAAIILSAAMPRGAYAAETVNNPGAATDAISIPRLIHYQGKLTDLAGIPITGTRSMMFKLYSGTSSYWNETQTVSVNRGIFNVLLGSATPISTVPEAGACSLQIIVEGLPIVPKVMLVSTPYCFNADKAHDIDDGAVTTPKLSPSAVTTDKILDGTLLDADLSGTGVTAGTYTLATITVNTKGRVTSASNGSVSGGVTSVSQALGVVCSPNPITGSGTVRLDTVYTHSQYIRNQAGFAQLANFWIAGAGRATQFSAASVSTGYPALLADGGTYSYGLSSSNNSATNTAIVARNLAGAGTAVMASGNNMSLYYHIRGTGGCFTGKFAGAMGISDDVLGFGVAGVNINLQGTGVGGAGNDFDTIFSPTGGAGGAFRGNAAGVYGRTDSAWGYGAMGFNYHRQGSAVVGLANRMNVVHLVSGSVGGSFNGKGAGAVGWSDSAAGYGLVGINASPSGTGVVGAGNNLGMLVLASGTGGSFSGRQYGLYAIAETTDGTRAGALFNYNGGSGVAVAVNDNGTLYKITGPGAVATTMPTRDGRKNLVCPEMPEAYFEDVGAAQLSGGHCRVNLAPLFADCVTVGSQNPLRVFVQLEDDCNGVYVKTDATGFDVYELQRGASNARFSYRVLGKWKGYEALRFADSPSFPQAVRLSNAVESRTVDTRPVDSKPVPGPQNIR